MKQSIHHSRGDIPVPDIPTLDVSVQEKLAALRRQLAGHLSGSLATSRKMGDAPCLSKAAILPLGLPAIDAHLGGGLVQAALHEISGTGSDIELATLPAFVASQLMRLHLDRQAIWVTGTADLYGPGLQALGMDPTKLLLVETHQEPDRLWALEEAARSGAVSLVIGEIDNLDLTASRRLQLAAEEKNCMILVLRRSRLAGKGDKHRAPSAAMTRWQIAPLPGRRGDDRSGFERPGFERTGFERTGFERPGFERPGLGQPCWRLHLWRQRNGPPGCWDITLQDQVWQQISTQPASSESRLPTALAANDDRSPHPANQPAVLTR